jgi:MATE family multidrug resistance protein
MIPFTTSARDAPSAVRELDQLTRLAAPLAVANLGQVLLGAVDTAVVGRLGAVELGAGGLGSSLFFTVAVLGTGVLLGFEPLVAQALGAGEPGRARSMLWRSMWVAALLTVPLFWLGMGVGALLEPAGIAPDTAGLTRVYLGTRLLGLAPYLLFVVVRSYLQARVRTQPVLAAVLCANLINLPLSWLLALGDPGLERLGIPTIGLPAFGVGGAAWASVAATVIQLVVLWRAVSGGRPRPSFPLGPGVTGRALQLGAPIGLTLLAEYGVFALVNLAMGNLDADALAAHQVAITFAAATFTVSLGVGAAAAVRVGRAVGAGDAAGTRLAGGVALLVGAGVMVLPAVLFWALPAELARVVTDRPEVVRATVPLLWVAAFFQLSDGLQAVAAGALRGAGDTRFALLANLVGHYGVGLPLGIVLAFGCGWGATGLWWGLTAGLTSVALALMTRFVRLTQTRVRRA